MHTSRGYVDNPHQRFVEQHQGLLCHTAILSLVYRTIPEASTVRVADTAIWKQFSCRTHFGVWRMLELWRAQQELIGRDTDPIEAPSRCAFPKTRQIAQIILSSTHNPSIYQYFPFSYSSILSPIISQSHFFLFLCSHTFLSCRESHLPSLN